MGAMDFFTNINLHQNSLEGVRIENLSTAPTNGVVGQIYLSTAGETPENVLRMWNGTEWIALATGGDTDDLADRVSALETTVGDSSAGLVKDVETLQTEVETAMTGLLARVSAIEGSAYATSGIDSTKVAQIATNTTAIGTINSSAVMNSGITAAKVTKLDGIAEGAQVNVIEAVQLNGTALAITSKTVNVDLTNDYYTKTQIDGKIAGAFHYKGTVTNYSSLPTSDVAVGDVYNITNAGGTDSEGHPIKAGDNVACSAITPAIKWDVLSGVVDLSSYYTKTETNGLLDGKVNTLSSGPTAGEYTKVTVTADGLVSAGTTLAASDIPDIAESQVTGLTTDLASKLDDSQLVTSWQSTVSDTSIPSEKLVKNSLDGKVDKVAGKGLSTEDFTTAEKTKLGGIATGAQVNVIETVKVNGTALTPDANKAVDVTVPTDNASLANGAGYQTATDVQGLIDAAVASYFTKAETVARYDEATLTFSSGTATVNVANIWFAQVLDTNNEVVYCEVSIGANSVTVSANTVPTGGLKLRYIVKPTIPSS